MLVDENWGVARKGFMVGGMKWEVRRRNRVENIVARIARTIERRRRGFRVEEALVLYWRVFSLGMRINFIN